MNINYDTCTKEELIASHKELVESHQEQAWKIDQLVRELDQLKRALFGAKSERFIPTQTQDQLNMFSSIADAQPTTPQENTHQVRAHERKEKIKILYARTFRIICLAAS